MDYKYLSKDEGIYKAIKAEEKRQSEGMELIASENYASPVVLEAMGCVLNNKYSEGYPGHRYYGGQEFVDDVENLAIKRAKKLFNAEHVNIQPLSGSPANAAVYMAFLKPGDKVLGLKLDHGGHLSHGHPVNFSGMLYNFVQYGVDAETGYVDMDEVAEIARQEKPKMIVAGYSAYSREIEWEKFKQIADEVGAFTFADIAHTAGLIAAGLLNNPVPFFDVVSTTTHKTLRGPRGAIIMCLEKYAPQVDRAVFPGMQGGPHDHINAAKAVALGEALKPEFKVYARQIITNAKVMAEELANKDYKIISGGTDNHLLVIDMTNKGVAGKETEILLDKVGISVSRSTIPNDPNPPMNPSGVRLGTPAITTRGMREKDVIKIVSLFDKTIISKNKAAELNKIKKEVKEFCLRFPVPGI
ncbi:serine hydroxymethyltransferase [Candidatus Falkowbacteria bacterium CG_4_9_14_3_um_filter_36_9]|uniref:Serine hydroxymethyltransferase n=2 Tax=Candidatus Falkowiibacteriota TaxID=1752728 RepID=A0A1J4T874_9BACT|nr:MAG: serine hydroxymethyltransferase [Candidatus Falkowbacteria bacterium CG1_02_37_44]PIV52028.1 MAG: serine hydroxymethyltransferase [Candidatus Falkowbacteria bacterium CG02_land_8_20_14_3_00_36_14]PJA10793.1 MAG: serine hydroxymethyltransferase [Candidatus Falkowbacteria bacterium CG_4_10_14_0_2_um_filter_36_22]PJB19702.1 MAG: serine hydroxymethyltransferase [Candidatus Falkowbacteria bacterium CG_4_9_14_3_um_filter_36_9]